MKICYGNKYPQYHREIIYDDTTISTCPLCEKEREIDRLQREIEALREKIGEKE